MADDKPPASAAAAGEPERRRPAPTIDLKATEVGGETATRTGSPDPQAGPNAAGRSLFWPLLGAVMAGAVLTLGLVLIVQLVAGNDHDTGAINARLAQLEQQVSDLAQ